MVLRGECSEQPPYASPGRAASTRPCSPPRAWAAAPASTRAALPLRSTGGAAPAASAAADNAARMHFQLAREASDVAVRGHADNAPQALPCATAAAGAGREVSFGHESVATTGTQSIYFAEDLLREQRSGGGEVGTSDGSPRRAQPTNDSCRHADDSMGGWECREGGIGCDGYAQSGGGELSWDGSKFYAGATHPPLLMDCLHVTEEPPL